jgi:hypothetical protein
LSPSFFLSFSLLLLAPTEIDGRFRFTPSAPVSENQWLLEAAQPSPRNGSRLQRTNNSEGSS